MLYNCIRFTYLWNTTEGDISCMVYFMKAFDGNIFKGNITIQHISAGIKELTVLTILSKITKEQNI